MEQALSEIPFIKKFKTENHHCIYDVNTNRFLRVDPVIYDIIDEVGNNGSDDIDHIVERFKDRHQAADIRRSYDLIKQMQTENNVFSNHRPGISSRIDSVDEVKGLLKSGLQQLILELTERCNQRCKYCAFSGRYTHFRSHGECDMTFDVAKKAVDFYIERAGGQPDDFPAITFYGGEPLLRFDLLKQVVQYVKARLKDKKTWFSFTSNGTLLGRKEIMEFLVENDISISVSLDGPKSIHDRYRRFGNNRGTFDRVMTNLKRLKEYSPGYFSRKVGFSVVLSPPYDFPGLSDFFYKEALFEGVNGTRNLARFNPVDSYETTFFSDLHLGEHQGAFRQEIGSLLDNYRKAMIAGTYDELTMEKELFLKDFHRLAFRQMTDLGDSFSPQGTCIPGQRRIFVSVDGKFYMCERVGSNYHIGDIHNGFDYERIYEYFQEYDRFFKDCGSCWALRLCGKCFNNIRKGDRFDIERRETFCRGMKKTIERQLTVFSEIIERNPGAFHVYDDISVR